MYSNISEKHLSWLFINVSWYQYDFVILLSATIYIAYVRVYRMGSFQTWGSVFLFLFFCVRDLISSHSVPLFPSWSLVISIYSMFYYQDSLFWIPSSQTSLGLSSPSSFFLSLYSLSNSFLIFSLSILYLFLSNPSFQQRQCFLIFSLFCIPLYLPLLSFLYFSSSPAQTFPPSA